MILPRFDYRKARSIEEAIELFDKSKGPASYLAGGTDLIPRIKLRLNTPSLLIDLKGINEMSGVRKKDGLLSIGANTPIFELRENHMIKENYPALAEAALFTSCETLQMRGTVGGNILQETRCLFYNKSLEWRKAKGFCYKMGGDRCNTSYGKNVCYANYLSDLSPALFSLKARLVLVGRNGERRCGIKDIFTGKPETPFILGEGEILKEIEIPDVKTKGTFEKIRIRGSIDYPLINGAISMDSEAPLLVIGAVGAKPFTYRVESFDDNYISSLLEKIYGDLKPVANTVVSPLYRKKMGKVIGRRLIEKIKKGV